MDLCLTKADALKSKFSNYKISNKLLDPNTLLYAQMSHVCELICSDVGSVLSTTTSIVSGFSVDINIHTI